VKDLLLIGGATVVVLAIVFGVVFGLRDTTVLVPEPQAVVEQLVRQLAAGRHRHIAHLVTADARRSALPDRLSSWWTRLHDRIGSLKGVEGEAAEIHEDVARTTVRIEGDHATLSLTWLLQREQGLWRVADLPMFRAR
jgi:hypothetical protein